MVTSTGSLRRIERLCASSSDERELRAGVLEELRQVLAFDAHVWVLTDPVTAVGVSPLADVPSFPELPTTIRLKYQAGTNRWTALARSARPAAALGPAADARGPDQRWRAFLGRHGIHDVASVVFADRYGTWGFLDLWRAEPEPFAPDELAYLAAVSPTITTALRARQAATFEVPRAPEDRDLGPVVVVIDDELQIVGETAATAGWLEKLLRPEPGRGKVPASVYNVTAQLLALEQGIDRNPAWARAHLGDGMWVSIRAARLETADTGADARSGTIAVTIEETSPTERSEVFGRAFGLTGRERELLTHLPGGDDTRALARALGISEYTVQDHLKAIFTKTGAPTRAVLVARATGR